MESEKVKEIKKALEYCYNGCDCECYRDNNGLHYEVCKDGLMLETLTLINELESENERLQKDCADIANDYQEMGKFYYEETEKNQQLKERIVELEDKCDDCAGCTQWKCDCANIKAEILEELTTGFNSYLDLKRKEIQSKEHNLYEQLKQENTKLQFENFKLESDFKELKNKLKNENLIELPCIVYNAKYKMYQVITKSKQGHLFSSKFYNEKTIKHELEKREISNQLL